MAESQLDLEQQCVTAFKQGNHDQAVQLLPQLQQPGDVTTEFEFNGKSLPPNKGVTLLHLAAYHGWLDIIKTIQQHISMYDVRDSADFTPLHYAAAASSENCLEMINYLIITLGCDPNAKTLKKNLPLHVACHRGNLDTAKYFITEHNCNPNFQTSDGWTPLQWASQNGHMNIIQYLITELGCDPTISNNYGLLPLHIASFNGHLNTVKYLISEQKCDPNSRTNYGFTPLYYASENGHMDIIQCLITELGCDPTISDNDGYLPLHIASLNGHLNTVKYFIGEQKCDPNSQTKDGSTPLYSASINGHMDIIQYLITEVGCDPTISDNGFLPLHAASCNGHLNTVKYFIGEQKCDPNSQGKKGHTPLYSASENGHTEIIQYLITELGCDPTSLNNNGFLPLHIASFNGHLNTVKYFISEQKCDPNSRSKNGFTPLHCASKNGHMDIIQYLITELGCDPTSISNNEFLPLHIASFNGHLNTVKYFINEQKCDPNCRSKNGSTPLYCASQNGHMDIIQYLITELGCDPTISNNNGLLPLHIASVNGHLNTVKYLIFNHNCDPNVQGPHGFTSLHYASQGGHTDIIQYLITEAGCDPSTPDGDGDHPLHNACWKGQLIAVKYLISEQNCDPNSRGQHGYTPLHYASQCGHLHIVQYLITELGCDPKVIDNNGRTILHLAAIRGHVQIVQWLLRDKRIDLMTRDKLGSTITDLAKENWKFQMLRFLHSLLESFNNYPIHTLGKTILIGNNSAGKIYLAKAINQQGKSDFKQLTSGGYKTIFLEHSADAGIVPSLIETSEFGNMVLYDLVGQAEYHSSHSAVMETVVQQSLATFINVIDLSNTDDEILQQLRYWLNFIENATCKTSTKSCLIIVGSYDHELSHEQVQSKSTLIRNEMQKRSYHQDYMGYVTIDYQDIESEANQEFVSLLYKSNQSIVARLPPVSCYCHLLYAFLMKWKLHLRICVLEDLMGSMPEIIPKETAFIAELLTTLSERGLILFLKNQPQLEKSWIVLDIESILQTVKKDILPVLEEFKDHRLLGSNTGIVRLSTLKQLFPQFNIEMLVGCLQTLELCHCVNLSGNSTNIQRIEAFLLREDKEDRSFFFPSLLDNCRPIVLPINEDSCFGWCLYCNKTGDQYFTSEFLHVLLLRLAYSFLMASSNSTNHLQSKCTVWTNGIYWDNEEEINTAVELIDHNRCVMVVMSHNNSRPVEFCKHRSAVIRLVLDLNQQLCPDVQTAEYLTSSRFHLRKWSSSEGVCLPLKSDLLPIENVAISMLQRKPFIFASSDIISEFRTKDALKYEPYYQLRRSSVCELMDSSKADEPVSQSLLDEVERICQMKQLKQPSHSLLRKVVDEMSIYAGKNPIVSNFKNIIIHY